MVSVVSLASSSSGNAVVVKLGETRLLLDCGIGSRAFATRCHKAGIRPEVDAILISHAHSDHDSGLTSMLNKYPRTIAFTPAATSAQSERYARYMPGAVLGVRDVDVFTFPVPHDITTCGFRLVSEAGSLCYITDAGHITETMRDMAVRSEVLIIEANYCLATLWDAPYPAHVRERIESIYGHLANHDVAAMVRWLLNQAECRTKLVLLSHIGSASNTEALAYSSVLPASRGNGKQVALGWFPRKGVSPIFSVAQSVRVRKGNK